MKNLTLLPLAILSLALSACSDEKTEKPKDKQAAAQAEPAPASEESFEQQARRHLSQLTRKNQKEWGMGKASRWDADLEKGFITWTFPDKTVRAPVQVIATYDPARQDLLWGWDHPSVSKELGRHARILKKWGQDNGVGPLLTRQITCSESEAWTYAAMAAKLAGAHGVYRGTEGQVYIFFTFDRVIIEDKGS